MLPKQRPGSSTDPSRQNGVGDSGLRSSPWDNTTYILM